MVWRSFDGSFQWYGCTKTQAYFCCELPWWSRRSGKPQTQNYATINHTFANQDSRILADGGEDRWVWGAKGDGSPIIERRAASGSRGLTVGFDGLSDPHRQPNLRIMYRRVHCTGKCKKKSWNWPGGSVGTASLATAAMAHGVVGLRRAQKRTLT